MSEKHYPYFGGSFDKIIFDGDGSVWVPESENAKLREQMERLVTLLHVDCDIDASWDGLRRFWSIGLTEGGCLMRDRACKAEAENAKLRELCSELLRMAETNDPDFLHWPEIHDELRKVGVEIVNI